LEDNDRIIFGNNSIFIIKIPKEKEEIGHDYVPQVDWEDA